MYESKHIAFFCMHCNTVSKYVCNNRRGSLLYHTYSELLPFARENAIFGVTNTYAKTDHYHVEAVRNAYDCIGGSMLISRGKR